MPYELNAVIGSFDLLKSQTAGIREAVVAPLRQRMGLVPVTAQLLEEPTGLLTRQDGAEPESRPFTVMSPAFEQTLSHWSRGGPISYVEADFHGGDGYQTAAVWRSGAKVWGPVRTRDFTGPREDWPINAALALLDVLPSGSEEANHHDLFLEVGLGGEQDLDGWQSAGRTARWAATYDEWEQERLAEQERTARAAAEFEKYRRLPDVLVTSVSTTVTAAAPARQILPAEERHAAETSGEPVRARMVRASSMRRPTVRAWDGRPAPPYVSWTGRGPRMRPSLRWLWTRREASSPPRWTGARAPNSPCSTWSPVPLARLPRPLAFSGPRRPGPTGDCGCRSLA
ncbi:hypothetical protein ABT300_10505 [Streptomyces sp. NPDC001027]|uniref:hypothetical protein n=1 Tax=Streptomyces sp. NPDC001027 TaxID=3154771 RepID=UPI003333F09D